MDRGEMEREMGGRWRERMRGERNRWGEVERVRGKRRRAMGS